MSPYSILGIEADADPDAVKAAWRVIARDCHPDKAGSDPASLRRFQAAKKAYAVLSDPLRRRFYDAFGQDAHALGLKEDADLEAALRARSGGGFAHREAVPRSECPACQGTGWRPNKRACTLCAPEKSDRMAAPPQPFDWDPGERKTKVGRFRIRPKKR